jgi:hypothetical protein
MARLRAAFGVAGRSSREKPGRKVGGLGGRGSAPGLEKKPGFQVSAEPVK